MSFKTRTIQDVLSEKYTLSFNPFLLACIESLTLPYQRHENRSDSCRLVEKTFSDNTIRDMVAYAIDQEVVSINDMICLECGGFSGGREKCSCEETRLADEEFAAEQLRKAACSL